MQSLHQPKSRGFTLIEILVVVGIIAILLVFAIPALNTALSQTRSTANTATLRILNTIAGQMRSAGITNEGSWGNDKVAAMAFYRSRGWIQADKNPNLDTLTFTDGVWAVVE
jgi:uncharacterized protein (TIGR02598 family)